MSLQEKRTDAWLNATTEHNPEKLQEALGEIREYVTTHIPSKELINNLSEIDKWKFEILRFIKDKGIFIWAQANPTNLELSIAYLLRLKVNPQLNTILQTESHEEKINSAFDSYYNLFHLLGGHYKIGNNLNRVEGLLYKDIKDDKIDFEALIMNHHKIADKVMDQMEFFMARNTFQHMKTIPNSIKNKIDRGSEKYFQDFLFPQDVIDVKKAWTQLQDTGYGIPANLRDLLYPEDITKDNIFTHSSTTQAGTSKNNTPTSLNAIAEGNINTCIQPQEDYGLLAGMILAPYGAMVLIVCVGLCVLVLCGKIQQMCRNDYAQCKTGDQSIQLQPLNSNRAPTQDGPTTSEINEGRSANAPKLETQDLTGNLNDQDGPTSTIMEIISENLIPDNQIQTSNNN